jgi:hypothetical protein
VDRDACRFAVPRKLRTMPFLYDGRPPAMRGETLYPLNQLESIDPVLYDLGRARYKGREAVLEFRIPLIDVLWNDALHLSTIHPRHLAAAWRKSACGRRSGSDPSTKSPSRTLRSTSRSGSRASHSG